MGRAWIPLMACTVITGVGYMMKTYTQLPAWSMYIILAVAVFTLSPLLYEVIRRIPVIR